MEGKADFKRLAFIAYYQQLEEEPETGTTPDWDFSAALVDYRKEPPKQQGTGGRFCIDVYFLFMNSDFKFLGLFRFTKKQKLVKVSKIPESFKDLISDLPR